MNEMGNATLAAVYMGVVKGIIDVIPKETNPEDMTYILTNNSDFAKIYGGTSVNVLNSFMIPAEAIDIAQKDNNKSFIGILRSPPMIEDQDRQNILNSEIFAIEMGTHISNLSHTINITYTNLSKVNGNLTCCSWNGTGEPSWQPDGCYGEEINNTFVCRCTHLTFFAVLMSNPVKISSSDVIKLTYITYIGCGVSTFFLGIALFMHATLRRSKSTKTTRILMNLFVSLFMLNLTFLLNDWITSLNIVPICIFIAGAIHYFLLSTFTWFAIEAFHLYLQLIKVFNINIRYYMVKILVVGWAFPLLVPFVIAGAGKYGRLTINTTDNMPVYMCWITDPLVNYIVNVGYYVAVFIFTAVVFIMVLQKIVYLRTANVGQPKRRSVSKDAFTVAGLCGMLGVTWAFAFFSSGPLLIPSYYIFTILNSFQGFLLFVYNCMTNNDAGESRKSTLRSTISNIKSSNISHYTVSKSQ
ncbi:adhesion G-protein coupled receptor G2-like isoform X2 [Brienomyrus brachyistius]|nr:adhesion G-protein coupled receptor G2-like isoform X2 [Brienomyrus brachyistius]